MRYYITMFALLCIPMQLNAEALPNEPVNCLKLKQEISHELSQPATCWTDAECQTVSWGCPWQAVPCHLAIFSTSEEERNKQLSQKIIQYSDICVRSDEDLQAKCDKFYAQVEQQECAVRLELMCLNGKCSTPIDVILQGEIDPADIYGSREIIEY